MRIHRNTVGQVVLAGMLLLIAPPIPAYVLYSDKWPTGSRVDMQLELGTFSGTLLDGTVGSWDVIAQKALAEWNTKIARVQFTWTMASKAGIGANNGYNNVFWSDTIYGQAFGARTLAYTTFWFVGGNTRTEADVTFNETKPWNSYRGPLKTASSGGYLYDFRRVVLHEFGHVLGLQHPDDFGQVVTAQMNSMTSNLDDLAADDIAGAQALYGAPVSAPPAAAVSRPTPGSTLSASDIALTWKPVSGASAYRLFIGSAVGKNNYFDSHGVASAVSSVDVIGLPTDGRRLYVRLYTDFGGNWEKRDFTYTALRSYSGVMFRPFPGAAVATPVTFQWHGGIGASAYRLWVGTGVGKNDLYQSKTLGATARSVNVSVQAPRLFVRLSTQVNGLWHNRDYQYRLPNP